MKMGITKKHNFIKQDNFTDSIADVKVDASFRQLSRNVICFHIWKVDEEKLEVVPRANFGSFYDDACYIVFASCPSGTYVNHETITREVKNGTNLERFIHFWLGERVNQQTKANVAHKVMELDSYFGNVSAEYRESQDNESIRFMSYFKRGITVLSGALSSSSDPCRLYQIKGRQWLRCVEMDSISWDHFSSEYIMILNTGSHTFVWIGRSSNVGDRKEALEIAKRFRKTSGASEIIIIDDGYEQSMREDSKQIWNTYLPRNTRIVNQGVSSDKPTCTSFKLYKCGYKGTKYWIDQVMSAVPCQSDFNDSKAVYILNGFSLGVWMWIGKGVPSAENVEAIRNGRGFIKKKKYPSSTLLIRVVEGHEPIDFCQLFTTWTEAEPKSTQLLGKFDTLSLCQRPRMAAENQLVDDGSGEKQVFRVSGDQLSAVPLQKTGVLFLTDNCYIVQYTVAFSGTEEVGVKHILYMWLGRLAPADVVTSCMKLAKARFDLLGDKTMIVRMVEGDEAPHFLQIFSGKLVILQTEIGASAMSENGISKTSKEKLKDPIILRIQGDSTYTSKALQIHPLNTLTSKDCYVIKSSSGIWVWCGQGSTGDAREVAKNIGSIFAGESTLVIEGKEPKEFWDSVSNQINQTNLSPNNSFEESPSIPAIGLPIERSKVHLFLCFKNQDKLVTQEILGFEQSDLLPENNYILDAGCITFVWWGKLSLGVDEESFAGLVQEYLETSISPRRTTTAMALIRQQNEPNTFTGFFESWNRRHWDKFVPYEQLRHEISRTGYANGNVSAVNAVNNDTNFDKYHKYPLSTLQQEASLLPNEVNPLQREAHLTHDDFVQLFNMPFSEFNALPSWRKQELKKKYKLF